MSGANAAPMVAFLISSDRCFFSSSVSLGRRYADITDSNASESEIARRIASSRAGSDSSIEAFAASCPSTHFSFANVSLATINDNECA